MVALWLAGVVALSTRLCIGWLGVQRLRRHGVRPVPGGWEERLTRIARQMRVSRPVRLLESALVEAPTQIGWLRPIVLVPAALGRSHARPARRAFGSRVGPREPP